MFALSVESSHQKGMGHLFRMKAFARYLESRGEQFVFLVNENVRSVEILEECHYPYHFVDYKASGGWEQDIIRERGIQCWVNDRLDTDDSHGRAVRGANIGLVTFDDDGEGARFADIQVLALPMSQNVHSKGRKVLRGVEYLIMSEEVDVYRRNRTNVKKVCISMGGSDTYGVTVEVVSILKSLGVPATVIIGPGFQHEKELNAVLEHRYPVLRNPSSLMQAFGEFDIMITAGGVTPFETAASGLPSIIIATEYHEIPNGEYLERIGAAYYAGYRSDINVDVIMKAVAQNHDVRSLSDNGIGHIGTEGCANIYRHIREIRKCA